MKKQNKKTAEMLRGELAGFIQSNPLPDRLSKASIVEELKELAVPETKKSKKIPFGQIASMAAALIILLGSITVFNLLGGTAGIKLVVDTLDGNSSVKHPAEITNANSYKEIKDIFKKLSKDAAKRSTDKASYGLDGKVYNGAAVGESSPSNPDEASQEHGETNVQVKGVDEPDIVKNDGAYLYTCSNNAQADIYSLLPADNMKLVSSIKYTSTDDKLENVNSLFVKDNFLIVLSSENIYAASEETTSAAGETTTAAASGKTGASSAASQGGSGTNSVEPKNAADAGNAAANKEGPDYDYCYYKNNSVCTVYDISDKTAPKQVKRISQDGSFLSARLIGNELYVLSSYDIDLNMTDRVEDVCIPSYSIDGKSGTVPAKDISITKNPEPSYLIVCGVNLNDLKAEPNTKAVLGGGSDAYCNADSLFVSRTVYTAGTNVKGWGADIAVAYGGYCNTEIYRFSIGAGKVEYQCAGKVKGTVLNQFAMDEYNGNFRIATTQSQSGNSMGSSVYILSDELQVVGKVENMAPKERIYAVRFMGNMGYVVTFEQTDPLFVLDLKDPKAPKITGELKLPGFSSYLHPISGTLLLGVGQNGNNKGTLPGIKLSLFDVSNPAKPKVIDTYIIEGNASTAAMNDHKAFLVDPEKEIFGLPVMSYKYYLVNTATTSVARPNSSPSEIYYSGVASSSMVSSFNTYTVKGNKIVPVRNYTDNKKQSVDSYDSGSGIIRGTYIEDTLYTLSDTALNSFSMRDGRHLDTLKIS